MSYYIKSYVLSEFFIINTYYLNKLKKQSRSQFVCAYECLFGLHMAIKQAVRVGPLWAEGNSYLKRPSPMQ